MYLSLSGINSANVVLNIANAPQSVGEDHILTSVAWASPTKLVAMWTNRVQNLGVIQVCEDSQCKEVRISFKAPHKRLLCSFFVDKKPVSRKWVVGAEPTVLLRHRKQSIGDDSNE